MDEPSENFNKVIDNIRNNHTEIITELKNTLEGFNSILGGAEKISDSKCLGIEESKMWSVLGIADQICCDTVVMNKKMGNVRNWCAFRQWLLKVKFMYYWLKAK